MASVGTLNECAASVAQYAEPDYIQRFNDDTGFTLDVEMPIERALLKRKFITQHLLVRIENRLPGYAGNGLFSGRSLRLSTHESYIGP